MSFSTLYVTVLGSSSMDTDKIIEKAQTVVVVQSSTIQRRSHFTRCPVTCMHDMRRCRFKCISALLVSLVMLFEIAEIESR